MTAGWKGGSVQGDSVALVVVDVQRGFVNHHSRDVIPAVVRLVDRWMAADLPVVFSRFYNPPGSPYEKITGWTRLRTLEEQALVDELAPYVGAAAAVIDKPGSSVFAGPGARALAGWSELMLCGIDTDACVYDSAVDAYQAGIRPWIITDACASSGGPAYHEAALLLAARNLGRGQLLTSDALLEQVTEVEGGRRAAG